MLQSIVKWNDCWKSLNVSNNITKGCNYLILHNKHEHGSAQAQNIDDFWNLNIKKCVFLILKGNTLILKDYLSKRKYNFNKYSRYKTPGRNVVFLLITFIILALQYNRLKHFSLLLQVWVSDLQLASHWIIPIYPIIVSFMY